MATGRDGNCGAYYRGHHQRAMGLRVATPTYREADGAKCLITFQLTHDRDSQISICRIPVSNSHFIRNPLSLQVDRRNVLINCHTVRNLIGVLSDGHQKPMAIVITARCYAQA